MEMLAANKMNLKGIFAAGWQEGERDVGERGRRERGWLEKGRKNKVASSLSSKLHQDDRGELWVNKVRETCHAVESKKSLRLFQSGQVVIVTESR